MKKKNVHFLKLLLTYIRTEPRRSNDQDEVAFNNIVYLKGNQTHVVNVIS